VYRSRSSTSTKPSERISPDHLFDMAINEEYDDDSPQDYNSGYDAESFRSYIERIGAKLDLEDS
jgi:hypothetical protein